MGCGRKVVAPRKVKMTKATDTSRIILSLLASIDATNPEEHLIIADLYRAIELIVEKNHQ